ncbi:MAG: sulfotransferase [Woeseiaceae bacterium]
MNDTDRQSGALARKFEEIQRMLGTDAARAANMAEEVVQSDPGNPDATLLLGVARRFSGDANKAIEVLQPLTQSEPESATAHYELGRAFGAAGRRDDSIVALRRAVELQPLMTGAWCILADELRADGQTEEADAVCRRRIEMAGRDPRLQKAIGALRERRFSEANTLLRQHLAQDPTDVVAMQMLAAVGLRMDQYEDAGNLLRRCLELAPRFAAAHHDYALVLDHQMRRTEALQEVEEALSAEPDNPNYRITKATILDRIGEYDQAIEIFGSLLEENQPSAWMSYGHSLRAAGRQDESVAAYKKVIEVQPSFGEAWWSLADLKTFEFTEAETGQIRRQLDSGSLANEDRLHFEFTLGKVLEDAGVYKESFEHYSEGNRLRRATTPYDATELTSGVNRSKALMTPEFFAERAGYGCSATDPIFIVGMPRAGSTLLEQVLASHSAVEGTMELPDMLRIVRELNEGAAGTGSGKYPEVLAQLSADQLRALGERFLESTKVYRKTDRPMFIDKMPNNFANVGLIQLLLPNARIVDARRHPLACCFSMFKQLFARGQPFVYDLQDLGYAYRDYVDLMTHFDQVLPNRVHRVFYERMVADTETEIRALLDYCGLPFEEACLRFYETERAVRTASSAQVRQPINRAGVDHWRHYEPWLDSLKNALGPALETYPGEGESGDTAGL